MKVKYLFAGMLILLGVGLIMDQYHVWTFGEILTTWWPLVIIVWGGSMLINGRSSLWFGLFVLFFGVFLQADKLNLLPGSLWDYFWPVILILIGVTILFSRKSYNHARFFRDDKTVSDDNSIDINSMFSGVNHRVTSQNFSGGKINIAFGGVELDLTDAHFAPEAFLDMSVSFGGVEIWVPRDLKIEVVGSPFLGGFSNKARQNYSDNSPVLKIKYSVAFGGIEIKN